MKRFLASTMAAIMLFSSTAFAQTNVIYNDTVVQYSDQTPVIINERTYVPIRDVFEALGFDVDWDSKSKIATFSNDYYSVYVNTDKSTMLCMDMALNVSAFKLEDEVQLINGRTMLPMREILEALNYSIQ